MYEGIEALVQIPLKDRNVAFDRCRVGVCEAAAESTKSLETGTQYHASCLSTAKSLEEVPKVGLELLNSFSRPELVNSGVIRIQHVLNELLRTQLNRLLKHDRQRIVFKRQVIFVTIFLNAHVNSLTAYVAISLTTAF